MKLIVDIPEDRYKWIIQRVAENENEPTYLPDLLHIIANGTSFNDAIEEYVERGAITENMIMLDKIDSIKTEMCNLPKLKYSSGERVYLDEVLEIIDKHLGEEQE